MPVGLEHRKVQGLSLSPWTRMSRSPLKFLERLPWLSHAAFFV